MCSYHMTCLLSVHPGQFLFSGHSKVAWDGDGLPPPCQVKISHPECGTQENTFFNARFSSQPLRSNVSELPAGCLLEWQLSIQVLAAIVCSLVTPRGFLFNFKNSDSISACRTPSRSNPSSFGEGTMTLECTFFFPLNCRCLKMRLSGLLACQTKVSRLSQCIISL